MKGEVIWGRSVLELFSELPEAERSEILEHLEYIIVFPQMYPVRIKGRRFRRHRWFLPGNWKVYYRVVEKTIYLRGIWPACIP